MLDINNHRVQHPPSVQIILLIIAIYYVQHSICAKILPTIDCEHA